MSKGKFYVKIIGIVFDPANKTVLVGKAKEDNIFTFIEDNLRYEEELDVGLKRVTKEKTGYEVRNLGVVFARNRLEKEDELAIYFLCEVAGGEEKLAQHIEIIKWVKSNEIEDLIKEKLPTHLKEYITNIIG